MAVEYANRHLPPGACTAIRQQRLKAHAPGLGFVPGSLHRACHDVPFPLLVPGVQFLRPRPLSVMGLNASAAATATEL